DVFIPARTIGDDFFRYHEGKHALIGDRTGETHRLGDRVSVRLVEAAPVAGALRFELLSDGRVEPGDRHARRGHSDERARSRPRWVHVVIWGPLTVAMALALLQPIKGAIVGWQWANYMHGFDPHHRDEYTGLSAEDRDA